MKKSKRNEKKKIAMLVAVVSILMIGIGIAAALHLNVGKKESSQGLLERMKSYQGYVRVVSGEEYDFYKYFVKRDLAEEVSEQELDEKVKAYINEVNAVFYLGNELGLYEPYSFSLLKLRMEQENKNRKLKSEKGEVIYGVEQFTLETYYQYERSNLEADIIGYIEANADKSILQQAEEYYEEHSELFTGRDSVTYEITAAGTTETVTADREQLDFLGNADRALADFLEMEEIGSTYTDIQGDQERKIVITDISYTEAGFENNKTSAVNHYIRDVLFPDLIETIAQNNPVEFE